MSEWCLQHPWMTFAIVMTLLMVLPTQITWTRKRPERKP